MQPSERSVSPETRRHILFSNVGAPVVMAAIAWVFYLGVALFDFDLVSLLKRRHRAASRDLDNEQLYFWLAIIATVLCLGYAWLQVRRALYLASCGVPVLREVVKVGRISAHGMVRVDYEYIVDGKTYRQCFSCVDSLVDDYQSGELSLEVVYDPRKPKRAMLKSDVFSKSSSPVDDHDSQTS